MYGNLALEIPYLRRNPSEMWVRRLYMYCTRQASAARSSATRGERCQQRQRGWNNAAARVVWARGALTRGMLRWWPLGRRLHGRWGKRSTGTETSGDSDSSRPHPHSTTLDTWRRISPQDTGVVGPSMGSSSITQSFRATARCRIQWNVMAAKAATQSV
eukprot:COSAG02_NODE_1244_length_13677_cov_50.752246_11_plen_159_part_00